MVLIGYLLFMNGRVWVEQLISFVLSLDDILSQGFESYGTYTASFFSCFVLKPNTPGPSLLRSYDFVLSRSLKLDLL